MATNPDPTAADREVPASNEVLCECECRPEAPIAWTAALDGEVKRRWLACQANDEIARAIGLPVKLVRSRVARLGQAPRQRDPTET